MTASHLFLLSKFQSGEKLQAPVGRETSKQTERRAENKALFRESLENNFKFKCRFSCSHKSRGPAGDVTRNWKDC